jgi:flavin reductase (DIM6/NTAB) family NADH-FMN oxidoreductase RutF
VVKVSLRAAARRALASSAQARAVVTIRARDTAGTTSVTRSRIRLHAPKLPGRIAAAEQTFRELVAQLDYPMFIATVATDEERAGCLIGFATQCSIHPPRFLAGISVEFGDHTGMVLEPVCAEVQQADDGRLGFHRAKRIDPGHEA